MAGHIDGLLFFMNILEKLLAKRGIKDVQELDPEEKKQYVQWEAVLSKETLTVPDIQKFCQSQVSMIETKWADINMDQSKKAELIPYHTVYKMLLAAIDSPKAVREALEVQLTQLITNI